MMARIHKEMVACAALLVACLVPCAAQAQDALAPAPSSPASTVAPQPGQAAPQDGGQTALLLPLRLPPQAGTTLKAAAGVLEGALRQGLERHASFRLMTRDEIAAMVSQAVQDQLMGCDAESCLADVAAALGAEFLVLAKVDHAGGLWDLSATLLERRKATAVRRASVRARSLDALLSSVDQVARQLGGGAKMALDDPKLAERLGTDDQGVAALKEHMASHPEQELSAAWTNVLASHNTESNAVALTEAGLVLGAGVVVMGTMIVTTPFAVYGSTAVAQAGPQGDAARGGKPSDGYGLPVLMMAMAYTPGLAAGVVATILLAAAVAVGVVDALDLGRLKVTKDGCCRDEAALRKAERPPLARRLAPFLAAAGGGLALALPAVSLPLSMVMALILTPLTTTAGLVTGPKIPVEGSVFNLFYGGAVGALGLVSVVYLLALGLAGLVAALALMASEAPPILDPDAKPVAVPAAKANTPQPGTAPAAQEPPAASPAPQTPEAPDASEPATAPATL